MIEAISQAPATPAAGATTGARDPEIMKAAEGMEGIFMSMLVTQMFKGTDVADAQPIYGGLMMEKFGDQLAADGGVGLADVLARQLGGES